MSDRNRVISQSLAVFVGPSPATGAQSPINQIYRVQSSNSSSQVNRLDVNEYGKLSSIDRIIIEPPTVSFDFSYLLANARNENNLGFVTDGTAGMISGILNKASDEKNYYKLTVKEGNDAQGNTALSSTNVVEGIGNGFITNYSVQAQVGQIPTASVSVEALNSVYYLGSTGLQSPAIIPQNGTRVTGVTFTLPAATSGVAGMVSALRPGDMDITIAQPQYGVDINTAKIQSFNLSVPLSRTPLNKIGSTFPFSREIDFPVNVELTVEAEVGGLATGSLSDVLCDDRDNDITISMYKPGCGGAGPLAIQYQLLGAKLNSQSFSDSIGANQTVSLSYSAQIGGPNDTNSNVYLSGTLN